MIENIGSIIEIDDIINKIQKYPGIVILCGCSIRTQVVIRRFSIKDNIDYIFDNDINKINRLHLGIRVIDYNKLNKLSNPLIIIWGNHISFFYNQIRNIICKNVIIEKRQYLTKLQNIAELLNSDFIFEIETPNYKINNEQNSSNHFIPILMKTLINSNINIQTKTVISTNDNYFKKRIIKNNRILFSYHSVGEKIKNTLRYKDGYLGDSIIFDTLGYSGWSSIAKKNTNKRIGKVSKKKAFDFFDKLSSKYIDGNKSKYEQPNKGNFIFPKKFIFFPLQTIIDSVMIHSYFEPLSLIKNLVRILNKKRIPLVIKRHPRCKSIELRKLLEKYEEEEKIIIYDASIHDAISKADTIYTINSGVGFESLLHLKPVISFGKSDYMSMTRNVDNLKDIKNNPFYTLDDYKKNRIKQFMYYFITEKCLFLDDEKKIEKILTKLIKTFLRT